jgi:hypothetical protein
MSRQLPAHPNLEYLKKQAKELLSELQQENPESQLADVQHTLAREYGFASWPKLKAHIESVARGESPARSAGQSPFAGTWKANVSKSRRHPANQFHDATFHFDVVGDIVTITNIVISASGHEERGENTIQVDGNEHGSNNPGYALVARWLGSHRLETVATKDGQVVGRGTYEVSPDGKTLTISTRNASANAVLDRRQ